MLNLAEVEFRAIRSRGKGGQNVNKVNTGIHLRFDICASSLNDQHKAKLLSLNDNRLSKDGVIVIKANECRTQEKNRKKATERLQALLEKALKPTKIRKPSKPSKAVTKKRLDEKSKHAQLKTNRKKVRF